jgi:anthranilate synthase component 1
MIKSFLYDELTPVALYAKIKESYPDKITMLFESVVTTEDGNFSFITIGAKERVQYRDDRTVYIDGFGTKRELDVDPFTFLKEYYKKIDESNFKRVAKEVGFNFVDGFIGYISYDMVKVFETTLKKYMDDLVDEIDIADLDLVRPKITIGFSHKNSTLTVIDIDNSYLDIFEEVVKLISTTHHLTPIKRAKLEGEGSFSIEPERFKEIVQEAKEHIKAGDIFQVLASNRYIQKGSVDKLSFYRILRSKNPSPYLFLVDFNEFAICGSSPEVMVRLTDDNILLRPIAGTRKRGSTIKRDNELESELINDPKERAEHLMLVDLGRNDVGRVAKVGSVKVPEMMRVERYSHVMHLVSDVTAKIEDDKDMFDLFRATFTAGTMTGAPKIKAMELIAKFEQLKRSFYSGSVGYFSFTKDMDSAIAIRTALIKDDEIILQAGAGVVADSVPELEELEVRNKLMALLSTIKELESIDEESSIKVVKEIKDV